MYNFMNTAAGVSHEVLFCVPGLGSHKKNPYFVHFLVKKFGFQFFLPSQNKKNIYLSLCYAFFSTIAPSSVCLQLYRFVYKLGLLTIGSVISRCRIQRLCRIRAHRGSCKRAEPNAGSANEWKSLCKIVHLSTNRYI